MVFIVSSERMAQRTLDQQCDGCRKCAFKGSDSKDALPGGFAMKGGSVVPGNWKKALCRLEGVNARSTPAERRNVNDFIRHVPVGVLQKDTRLLHVSNRSAWMRNVMVGSQPGAEDDYSFFTLENRGMAAIHGSHFDGALKLRLVQDLHCFFSSSYDFRYYDVVDKPTNIRGKTRRAIEELRPGFGNGVKNLIKEAWPAKYRPAAWASCSECEIVIHNSIIPRVLEVISVGHVPAAPNAENPQRNPPPPLETVRVVRTQTQAHEGISTPYWMSPFLHSRHRVTLAERQSKRAPLDSVSDAEIKAIFD